MNWIITILHQKLAWNFVTFHQKLAWNFFAEFLAQTQKGGWSSATSQDVKYPYVPYVTILSMIRLVSKCLWWKTAYMTCWKDNRGLVQSIWCLRVRFGWGEMTLSILVVKDAGSSLRRNSRQKFWHECAGRWLVETHESLTAFNFVGVMTKV